MRDVAYWPRTFLDEVERSLEDGAPVLWALGGPSFVLRTPETTVWIDPYFSGTPDDAVPGAFRATAIPIKPDEVRLADIVISTHDHIDHCHEGTLLPLLGNTNAVCVAPKSSAKLMRSWGIADDRIRQVKPGDTVDFRDLQLSVHASYDPNEPHAVTFVASVGETTLFISGDTSHGPALAEIAETYELDYALLAFGRTWYMDEAQLLEAASTLRPGTLLPFHWEFWRNHTGDIAKLFELYFRDRPRFELKMLLVGDSLRLAKRTRRGRAA
jgi:L-ascorbate metabolism protein UlaG (beta-lactamase superfamily)